VGECKDKKIRPLNDSRLTPELIRLRSGTTQVFRESHSKYENEILIEPPNRHHYAELIDGVWWWVNGCAECNGKPRDWMTYIECEEHDVCRTCRAPRSQFKDSVWGGKCGWQCKPCHDYEHAIARRKALESVAEKEYDDLDYKYNDEVVCPHCGTEWEPDCEIPEGEQVCEVCGGKYLCEPNYEITYNTTVIGKRITLENME
jgi:hypothetical protein